MKKNIKVKSPVPSARIKIKEGTNTCIEFLDTKTSFQLKHGNGSMFRLSDLPGGIPDARLLTKPEKMFSTATTFAWAMLPQSVWAQFPRPVDFALLVRPDDIGPVLEAVTNALFEYSQGRGNEEKNG